MKNEFLNKDQKILIIGLGLIGGSYAKALTKQGYSVYAIDKSDESIAYAIENGIILDGGTVERVDLIKQADVMIFGLYPTMMIEWIKDHQHLMKHNLIITDVSGVKCNVINVIQDFLRDDIEFIGSHPMAGREVSGVQNSNDELFRVANYIVTPTNKNTERGVAFAKELGKTLGFLRIVELSPQKHDEMIGYLSQLTHAIAVSLMNANDNTHLKEYTGDSFRDLTRIAKINEHLWSELFFLNKEILISEIDSFSNELQNLKQKLVNDDEQGLKELFVQSTRRRTFFDQ